MRSVPETLDETDLKFLRACIEGLSSALVGTPQFPISAARVRRFWRRGIIEGKPHHFGVGPRSWNALLYTLTDRGRQALDRETRTRAA